MSDLISALQGRTGLDEEAVIKGLGALLNFLKENLPPELFGQVEGALPRVREMIADFQSGGQSTRVLSKVGDLVGGLFGGKAGQLPELFEMLSKSGLSLDQAGAFLPAAIESLKRHLPDGLVDRIVERLPGLGEAFAGAEA
ncbi:hypothetical protein ElP_31540 [Tautonia plasticadhaerens]|uniref:DUF2780 domain-containing protein n=2 Tax=Tautonia plasticadhaerens TaxID=2527974 RepID=A0A518H334_9BACT|nr:DUF2780 domain-containing protein [Tautonia plasticadhaerens]QDV35251.1 hypothetical protein ElP_31540 [Tautonia plasticadhaerens]